MKKIRKIHVLALGGMLLMTTGCGVVYPRAITSVEPQAEPVSYYGPTQLFAENRDKLRVKIICNSSENSIAENAGRFVSSSDGVILASGKNHYDVLVNINSGFKQITAAPRCIYHHDLNITVTSADGVTLCPAWYHKSESNVPRENPAEARNQLVPDINRSVENWIRKAFLAQRGQFFDVSILRFKTTRKFIEFDPYIFEDDIRVLLNKLRKLNGIVSVHLIETDKSERIASFRVVYRKDEFPAGLSRKIK